MEVIWEPGHQPPGKQDLLSSAPASCSLPTTPGGCKGLSSKRGIDIPSLFFPAPSCFVPSLPTEDASFETQPLDLPQLPSMTLEHLWEVVKKIKAPFSTRWCKKHTGRACISQNHTVKETKQFWLFSLVQSSWELDSTSLTAPYQIPALGLGFGFL